MMSDNIKYVYTLKYLLDEAMESYRYSFVSSASFEQALKSACDKVHRQHPSQKIDVRSFIRVEGDEVTDNE